MSAIRVVVVDDEPLARRRIVRLLEDREGFELAGESDSGRKAALAIPEIDPDLLFLDVQMPEMGGFEVLESLSRSRPPVVIFVTAYNHYAVRAFEVHALDYIMKPFDDDRFDEALVHARAQLRMESGDSLRRRLDAVVRALHGGGGEETTTVPAPAAGWIERLVVRSQDHAWFVRVSDRRVGWHPAPAASKGHRGGRGGVQGRRPGDRCVCMVTVLSGVVVSS